MFFKADAQESFVLEALIPDSAPDEREASESTDTNYLGNIDY